MVVLFLVLHTLVFKQWSHMRYWPLIILVSVGPLTLGTYTELQSYFLSVRDVIRVQSQSTLHNELGSVVEHGVITDFLIIDQNIEKLNRTRQMFIRKHPDAGSNVYENVHYQEVTDIVKFAPKAILVGWLAPFPYMWFTDGATIGSDLMRTIAALEMIAGYLGMIGVLWLLVNRRYKLFASIVMLIFTCTLILIMALAIPNLGTLYRFRLAPWLLVITIGLGFIIIQIKQHFSHMGT
jgi:hypothetical protein